MFVNIFAQKAFRKGQQLNIDTYPTVQAQEIRN